VTNSLYIRKSSGNLFVCCLRRKECRKMSLSQCNISNGRAKCDVSLCCQRFLRQIIERASPKNCPAYKLTRKLHLSEVLQTETSRIGGRSHNALTRVSTRKCYRPIHAFVVIKFVEKRCSRYAWDPCAVRNRNCARHQCFHEFDYNGPLTHVRVYRMSGSVV